MKRIWAKIKDTAYSVSSDGLVRNDNTNCLKTLGIDRYGYQNVELHCNGKRSFPGVHRLVANAFIPNTFNKPQINHKDGNKLNNNVSNLEWATAKENMEHASRNDLLHHKFSYEERMNRKLNKSNVDKRKRSILVRETWTEYQSIADCCKATNSRKRSVQRVLNGERKTHNGLHFEYVN